MRLQIVQLFLFSTLLLAGPYSTGPVLERLEFSGDFHFPPEKLQKITTLQIGKPFSIRDILPASQKLQSFLYDNGYLYAGIDSVQQRYSPDSGKVRLRFYGRSGIQALFDSLRVQSDSLDSEKYRQKLTVHEGQPYSRAELDRSIAQLLNWAADRGFPYAEVTLSEPEIKTKGSQIRVGLTLSVHEHEAVYIQDIQVRGNSYTRDKVVLRELNIRPGQRYSGRDVRRIPGRLNRLGIFKQVGEPQLFRSAADSVTIRIPVTEGNATSFDGVVGYVPGSGTGTKDESYFTGLVNIAFRNLLGSGRKFEVHWKKPDRLSEEFNVAYNEPWVLDYPIDLGAHLGRTVRDTTFLQWGYGLDMRLRLFHHFVLTGRLQKTTYLPDSASSRDLHLAQNEIVNARVGVEYDTRDYPVNPRSGIFYSSHYTFGLKHNLGPVWLLTQDSLTRNENLHSIFLHIEFYYPFGANQVFAFSLSGKQVKGNQLQLTDYFWFGGSRTLRGYRENQFRGSSVAWTNLEYRFLMARNARIFLFNDWGFYSSLEQGRVKQELLPGFGLGLRFETPLGIMGVDFGLGKGDSFREAKIHFGLVNRF